MLASPSGTNGAASAVALPLLPAGHVRKQHVVSEVVLRQFASTDPSNHLGMLEITDLNWPSAAPKHRGAGGCGFENDFVRHESASLEQLWNRTETRLPAAIDACTKGIALGDPIQRAVLQETIALHLVRNLNTRVLMDNIWTSHLRDFRLETIAKFRSRLDRFFVERYSGLESAGDEGRGVVVDAAISGLLHEYESGVPQRQSLERLFRLTVAELATTGLEVSTTDAEFVISDTPAITIGRDGRSGLLQGVGIRCATNVLPLTPRIILSTGPVDALHHLDQARVDSINLLQIRHARQHVYCRPGSGLGTFIRSNAGSWRRQGTSRPS